MRTKYRGFVSTLNKANETLVREIKSNVGKNGAVYKDPSGNFYSGKGEPDGREFVAKVYHQVVYCDRKKPPPFVADDYAQETCEHALFEYFYLHYVVWEKPTAKVLNIRELGKVKKTKNNREANPVPPPYKPKAPLMGESRITTRAFYKKNTIFPDFGDAISLRILSTFDSRAFRRI